MGLSAVPPLAAATNEASPPATIANTRPDPRMSIEDYGSPTPLGAGIRAGVALEELHHPAPGVVRGLGVVLLLAVEEAVGRSLEGHDLVLDACVRERLLEGCVVLGGDVRVRAALEREHRRLDLPGARDRPRVAVAVAGHAVEADRTGKVVAARGCEPGVVPTEPEAEREDVAHALATQPLDCRAHVGLDPLGPRLLHVLRVLEVVTALLRACGPAEVVDRDRRITALGEAQGELFVEAVEAAHIGEDDDARRLRLFVGYCLAPAIYIAIGVTVTDFLYSFWVGVAYVVVAAWAVPMLVRRLE